MAGYDPWINWSWLKIGPFTPTAEDRVGADRRRAEIEAQDKENKKGLGSLPVAASTGYTPIQQAVDSASGVANALGEARQRTQSYPENFKDWNILDSMRSLFSEGGDDAYRKARGVMDEEAPPQIIIPAEQGDGGGSQPAVESDITRRAREANEGLSFPQYPEEVVPAPVQTPVIDPQQQMIEDLKRQKALIDQIYPQRPVDNTAYQQADEYAMAEKERAKNLANLAFFSAVTQGAGGQWEGVGRGFAAAGQVYSKGFERYQDALNAKAKRMVEQGQQQYDDQVNRSDAALKLYSAEQDRQKGMLSEARQSLKDRQANIDTYFKERLKLAKGDELNPTNQTDVDRIMTEWRLSRDRGEITSLTDVKDKEK